ncbi:tyrosine-protein phosphatase 10D-like [Cydia splendana]|uniref:tyrosine-protein phosphatase 10D-like n=1 Tax=Cydia splendana TaxID=1100963 RepID=UPI00300C336C
MRLSCGCVGCEEEKVSRETFGPSMMWMRSFAQATAERGRALPAQARLLRAVPPPPLLLALLLLVGGAWGADLVIEIPGSGAGAADPGGEYRLDYRPPHGSPAPNFTVPARASTINFQGLPGTKYHFMLYYSNATFADLLTWNQTIITAPEPPTNLTVSLSRNKQATIAWAPPSHGEYTGFRFKVIPLTERAEGGARNITVEAPETPGAGWTHTLKELSPGATYQLHAFTLLHDKESAAYASRNFTTKPNTPGKFIVWFRNETTLLVLWQPPYPPGAYTHYKVSIVPPDARESELYVEKEGEPPGPAQAAFKGLVPGRPYNISVQTVSEPEISAPTTAQYRTVPLRPRDVQIPARYVTPTKFRVTWLPPKEESEFEKYQVSVSGGGAARRLAPVLRARNETPAVSFEGLEPGAHYTVTVKTMSGKVTSWPAPTEITLKPLPVQDLQWRYQNETDGGGILVWWTPAEGSTQDEYKVSYHEAHGSGDSSTQTTPATNITLDTAQLLPGRNYTVAVTAVSRGVDSAETTFSAATRPLAPVVRTWGGAARQLSLAWSSDVNSRQDHYELRHRRRPEPGADMNDPEYTFKTITTTDTNATLSGLFPGAVYEVTVAAVSHGLRSERHTVFKPVRPLPPTWMGVERATSNSVVVRWRGPGPGSKLGAFLLQYRTHSEQKWTKLPPLQPDINEAEVVDMTHGERYTIQLDTLSEAVAGDSVDSGEPREADHTVRPNPVSNVAALVDTRNMTLEWPVPAGRVERYGLRWWPRPDEVPDAVPAARNLTAEPGVKTVRALLDALEPGVGYTLTVHAVSYNLTSDLFTMETRTRPLIQSEMTIVNEPEADVGNDTLPAIRVLYTLTPATASRFDSYRFRLEGGPGEAQEQTRAAAAPAARVEFKRLVPGRLYNVTMWTVSGNVTSHPVQRPTRLYPRPVAYLKQLAVGARNVTLTWPEPAGDYTDFELQYLTAEDTLEARSTTGTEYTVQDLQPHTNYVFTIEVRSGTPATLMTRSAGLSVQLATRQAPPPAPRAFHPTDAKPNQLTFSWDLPANQANGVLEKFVIEYAPQNQPEKNTTITFPPEARSGVVAGLTPGGTYSFRLWAATGAGAGPAARWTQHLAIAAPPRPAPHALPAAVRATPTTVSVRFRNDFFSSANGNVSAYALVVAQEPRNDSSDRLPSWRDVHGLPVWPPYQVTEPYFPFHHSSVEEYTIGSERCESSGRAYCNGPLRPGAAYYVKLRAYTAPDKYTDTAYAVVYTEVDNTAWIIGVCAGAACVAGAGAAWAALRRRRPRAAPAPPAGPAPRTARPVPVADFVDHYRLMSADSDFRFSEEFEELKHVGREQPCTAADLPVNRPKNRFTNILPYDHSRYKLQPVDDEEGSDYINANYVPGHSSPREFIVTQGPLHCTRDDFWRMVWESGSRAIVMLTRCVEKGREKCDRYWPYDTRPVYYGDIAVTALNESRFPDWTITELLASRGAEQRVVKHFHFTTWPDFGVPDPPTTLARFVRAFRERCPPDARPVVVHCSAGVGRSGTFITLDRALQQLAARADTLDIFGMVYAMRRERVWMVQTEQQYICIHQCVVAALEGADLQPPLGLNHHMHHNQAFEDDEGIAESGM